MARYSFHIFTVALVMLVASSMAGSLQKRDLEESADDIRDFVENNLIPEGARCINDNSCSVVEYCDARNLNFHCRLTTWFIIVVVAMSFLILVSILLSCLCCPCCCLYHLCRKR